MTHAQTLVSLNTPEPGGTLIALQLTDGTVMAQSGDQSDWYRLTPDINGSYVNGTWTKTARLPSGYSPYAFPSAVLADGRMIIEGGEYNPGQNFSLTNLGAIYDPVANTWTPVAAPRHYKYIGDSSSLVLPDGRYVLGDKLNTRMAAFDPKTNKWKDLPSTGHLGFASEETWTLLPDGTILTENVKKAPHTQIYDPATGVWTSAGQTPVALNSPPCCACFDFGAKKPYCPPGEIGPALLMPDGSVFATGGIPQGEHTAHTAIYRNGTWTAGPDVPNHDDMGDSFASLLPNGHALVEAASGALYEFDGTSFITTHLNAGGNSLMVLPTGEILIGGLQVYRSTGTYNAAWAPTVTNCPSNLTRGTTFTISGTQFNGLSQANSFGDELETFTNYPLVRITNNATGHVFYARTHDHSSMGVATGSATVSTNVDVPSGMETGASSLVVVANGIPSVAVPVTVN
ncbi:MAG: hypothetical protein JO261_15645 [Alphaproteobacteria bacterium]|nr:hypothetical protein [Alphaproteobacteria bacterium]MBV9695128.1 hypothetical protein [Alphaproteobacteria bacterium]